MTLEAVFRELPEKLMDLQSSLKYLEVFIGDKPHAHKLADDLSETVTDLWSRIDEAIEVAHETQAALQPPTDLARVRLALVICQEQFNIVSRKFTTELRSEQQMRELARLSRRLKGEWPGWARSVKQTLEQCQVGFHDVNEALSRCWQEIAERVGMTSVSMQTTNIGQQIVTSEDSSVIREQTV